jgi:hypothetical protein
MVEVYDKIRNEKYQYNGVWKDSRQNSVILVNGHNHTIMYDYGHAVVSEFFHIGDNGNLYAIVTFDYGIVEIL